MKTTARKPTIDGVSYRLVAGVAALVAVVGCGSDASVYDDPDLGGDSLRGGVRPCRTATDIGCCGNSRCEVKESCSVCAADCPCMPAAPCGNGTCDADEDCASCTSDCGPCPAPCGNGTCDADEDCASCASDCGSCPVAPLLETLSLECESGALFGGMQRVSATDTASASAGAWVEAAASTANFLWSATAPLLPPTRVELPVRLQGGSYRLWVRMSAPASSADALYAGFGATDMRRFYPGTSYVYGSRWTWLGDVGTDADRLQFELAAGDQRLVIGGGETGARCDALVLTSDPSWLPADEPPTVASCGDGTCDALEHCSDCPADCGPCVADPPIAPSAARRPDGTLPVFPGAEGFGAGTVAGRGGQIIKVTNLNDSGTGSFRAAVTASGPRLVVFEVGGSIELLNTVGITNPYLTIAGQTAPDPGIQLKNYGLELDTHDVLIQHLRVRISANGLKRDGVRIFAVRNVNYNIVIDHVTTNWATDENMSIWGGDLTMSTRPGAHDITISNCLIAESTYGLLIGSDDVTQANHIDRISVIDNLFAHNSERNPLVKNNSNVFVANNLGYNPTWGFGALVGGDLNVTFVKNHFVTGANTLEQCAIGLAAGGFGSFYVADNLQTGVVAMPMMNSRMPPYMVTQPPVFDDTVAVGAVVDVRSHVLASAGARPAARDAVERRIITEVSTASGVQKSSGVWPTEYNTPSHRLFDGGTNPGGDADGDGYTNVEEILHQMAAAVEGR